MAIRQAEYIPMSHYLTLMCLLPCTNSSYLRRQDNIWTKRMKFCNVTNPFPSVNAHWTHTCFYLVLHITFHINPTTTGLIDVGLRKTAVLIWPRLSSPTPPAWESWKWVIMICRIQEWSCCVQHWRVHIVDLKLWGQLLRFMFVNNVNIESVLHWLLILIHQCKDGSLVIHTDHAIT